MANTSIIPEDYNELRRDYLDIKKKQEQLNQSIYEKSKEISRLKALESEHHEIEVLFSEEKKKIKQHEQEISHLKESIDISKLRYSNKIQELECELFKKSETIDYLNKELQNYKIGYNRKSSNDDVNKLLNDINCLEKANLIHSEVIEELKLNLEESKQTNSYLENTLMQYKEELTNMKEILCCKSEDLAEARRIIEKLNDDVLRHRCELESVKSKPLDQETKGNSLFAEVDDRRVYLQNAVTKMKSEYITMKQEYSRQLQTIRNLKAENITLLERWKSESRERQEDNRTAEAALQARIKDLEFLVDKYKCELEALKSEITDNAESDFFFDMYKYKENEVEEFRKQLSVRSFNDYLMAKSLREANEEKRKWRVEAALKDHLLQLKTETALNNEELSLIREKITKEIENIALEQTNCDKETL